MLDELITEVCGDNELKVSHTPLSTFLDFKLVRIYEEDPNNGRSYIRLVVIMIGNEVITTVYSDSNQIKSEIRLFDKGNALNRFFKFASLNTKSKQFKALGYVDEDSSDVPGKILFSLTNKFSLSKRIYIGIADAETIMTNWNGAFKGYSMTRLIEYPTKQTLESLSTLLADHGYLQ